jgi:alkylated DNA repair protein alkB family protein 7
MLLRHLFTRRASTVSHAAPWFWDSSSLPFSPSFGVRVIADFLTEGEEAALSSECDSFLRRLDYESGHWDGVISNYKEVQRDIRSPSLSAASQAVLRRAQAAFPAGARNGGAPLPFFHALELAEGGSISAHVDSIKFSGGVVAGLCLLSDAVMVLTPDTDGAAGAAGTQAAPAAPEVRLLLPRRCFYTLTDEARYAWAHAVPAGAAATFRGAAVKRGRRLSIMLRDALEAAHSDAHSQSVV